MTVELTFGDLRKLKMLLAEALQQSTRLYEQLLPRLHEKDATLTAERVEETLRAWVERDIEPDSSSIGTMAKACAYYRGVRIGAENCLEALSAERPAREAVIAAHAADSALWRGIALMTAALNGAPLAQGLIDAGVSDSARRAAFAKHAETEKAKQILRDVWNAGEYRTKTECATEKGAALGLAFSTAMRALANLPDPKCS